MKQAGKEAVPCGPAFFMPCCSIPIINTLIYDHKLLIAIATGNIPSV